jgi:hypothetical protein
LTRFFIEHLCHASLICSAFMICNREKTLLSA